MGSLKMEPKFATFATFQRAMLQSNELAALNIKAIVDTEATFHLLMSALNVGFLANSSSMLETDLTSQSAIGPYVVVAVAEFVTHDVTAP